MPVDPETIEVGQQSHFACTADNCTYGFWRNWLPSDAVTMFGDMRHYAHDPPVLMVIDQVKSATETATKGATK